MNWTSRMGRSLAFFSTCILVLAIAGPSFAVAGNLLSNPGFESGLGGWNSWGGTLSAQSPHSGSSCLLITQTKPSWAGTDQLVAVGEGAVRATLSGWMRTQGVVKGKENWEKARFVLNFKDANGTMVGGYQASTAEAVGDTEWTRYEKSYTVPAGTTQVEVQMALGNCAGSVWFDDMELLVEGADGKSLVRQKLSGPMDEGEWYELSAPAPGEAGHWADWSSLLDGPAGKHGFLEVTPEGTFRFQDGTPARFWGTNLVAGAALPTKEEAERTALRLSKMGCNLVRLHHMDASWFRPNIFGNGSTTRELNEASLERLDHLVAALKAKGIYIFLDLLVHRDFLPADGVTDRPPDMGGKQVGFFDPKLIELQKEYATQLLTHVNPHTGKAYKDEPAIVGSEFINESTIFMHFGTDILTPPYRAKLEALWKTSPYNKGGALAVFEQDWSAGGRLKMKVPGDGEGTLRFLSGLEEGYFKVMRDHLRKLGVRYPLSGSNMSVPILADMRANAKLDFVAMNNYWDHPQIWKINNDWSRVLYAPFDNKAQLRAFQENTLSALSQYRAKGKPFVITEWNDCFPNEHRLAGVPVLAAYAALQGWDATLQFDFDHTPMASTSLAAFTLSKDPGHLAQWVMAAPLFLRGDVKRAPGEVVESLGPSKVFQVPSYSDLLARNPGLPFVTRVSKAYEDKDVPEPDTSAYKAFQDEAKGTIRSETGELLLDHRSGVLTIDTPLNQGMVGFLKGRVIDLPAFKAEVGNSYASLFLVSRDGKPLLSSRSLYLVVGAPVKQKGLAYQEARKALETVGGTPLLAQVVKGRVTFKNIPPGAKATLRPLSTGGTPGKPLALSANSFRLEEGRSMVYELEVEALKAQPSPK